MTIVETRPIIGGVDTHLDVHVAAALDANGGVLGVESFPTTIAGFTELHTWLCSFGTLCRVGVEGTGAYGAGLARSLRAPGVAVVEVDRPNRQARRRHGKSDAGDAVEAARAASTASPASDLPCRRRACRLGRSTSTTATPGARSDRASPAP